MTYGAHTHACSTTHALHLVITSNARQSTVRSSPFLAKLIIDSEHSVKQALSYMVSDRHLQEHCFTTLQQIASNLTNSMTSTQSTVAPTSSSSIFSLSSQSSASVPNAAIPAVVTTSSAGASVEGSMHKSINLIHYCTFEEAPSVKSKEPSVGLHYCCHSSSVDTVS